MSRFDNRSDEEKILEALQGIASGIEHDFAELTEVHEIPNMRVGDNELHIEVNFSE